MEKKLWDSLPKRLQLLRSDRSLTQQEVVDGVQQYGVHFNASFLSRVENGTRSLSPEQLTALAQFYNVSADFLLCLTDDETPANAYPETLPDRYITPEADKAAELLDEVRNERDRKAILDKMAEYVAAYHDRAALVRKVEELQGLIRVDDDPQASRRS